MISATLCALSCIYSRKHSCESWFVIVRKNMIAHNTFRLKTGKHFLKTQINKNFESTTHI